MIDSRYFDLRCLTENIFYFREYVLPSLSQSSQEYIDAVEIYEDLWKQRDKLEHDIFYKE